MSKDSNNWTSDNVNNSGKLSRNTTESDAIHPRFLEPNEKEIRRFQIEHEYFCQSCGLFFAPTVLGLREHFKPGRILHLSTRDCIYCKKAVYDYYLNNRIRYYHDCTERSPS